MLCCDSRRRPGPSFPWQRLKEHTEEREEEKRKEVRKEEEEVREEPTGERGDSSKQEEERIFQFSRLVGAKRLPHLFLPQITCLFLTSIFSSVINW